MIAYEACQNVLRSEPKTWLITGVAGFIGSNLLEALLKLDQRVVGVDNFSTGFQRNLDEVKGLVTQKQWKNFIFIQGDICNVKLCERICKGVNYVLHQAALGSVPRSIENPIAKDFVARKAQTIALSKVQGSCQKTSNNQNLFTSLKIPCGFHT